MRLLDKLLMRRRKQPRFSELPLRVRNRLSIACRELSEAEQVLASRLGLQQPPRLLMVDEEYAVILSPGDRAKVG